MINVLNHWYVGQSEYVEIIKDLERMTIRRSPKGTLTAYDFNGDEIDKTQEELNETFRKIVRELR